MHCSHGRARRAERAEGPVGHRAVRAVGKRGAVIERAGKRITDATQLVGAHRRLRLGLVRARHVVSVQWPWSIDS